MSRICGIATRRSDFDLEGCFRRIYEASSNAGRLPLHSWTGGGVRLGWTGGGAADHVRPQISSADQNGGGDGLVTCGKFVGWDETELGAARGSGPQQCLKADADFMLDLLQNCGTDALGKLNGIFSAAYWHAAERRLVLITDRLGCRPIYYLHNWREEVFLFSSDLCGIVQSGLADLKPDWDACSAFLYFGHNLGDRTLFQGISVVPPASVLSYADGKIRIVPYWNINSVSIDERMSYDEALEGSIHCFARAIRRRHVGIPGRKMVFLSGGLDSSRIAAELKRQECEFVTYTTRGFHPAAKDRLPARKVADALGVPNTFVDLPGNFVSEYWQRSASLTDYETCLHQWMLPLIEAVSPEYTINYDGLGGDTMALMLMADSPLIKPERFAGVQQSTSNDLATMLLGKPASLGFLSKGLRQRLSWESAVQSVRTELRKYEATANRVGYFILMNRTRRATALAPFKLILLKAESLCPYFDNEFFDFTMSIPPAMKNSHSLRNDIVDRAYPHLRGIPLAKEMKWSDVANDAADSFPFRRLQRQLHFHRVRDLCLRNGWMFSRLRATPRALRYLLGRRDFMFNDNLVALLTWFARYFPHGV
jgi:asparagine synthetase B (glutamine-hydrolysing)